MMALLRISLEDDKFPFAVKLQVIVEINSTAIDKIDRSNWPFSMNQNHIEEVTRQRELVIKQVTHKVMNLLSHNDTKNGYKKAEDDKFFGESN